MRKKIEELRNKEEGFTLVELLAVIVILGIIVAIAIPAVGSVIDRAGTDSEDAETQLIVDAARLYYTSEDPETVTDSVDTETLIEKGYLEERADGEAQEVTVHRVKDANGKITYTTDAPTAPNPPAEGQDE